MAKVRIITLIVFLFMTGCALEELEHEGDPMAVAEVSADHDSDITLDQEFDQLPVAQAKKVVRIKRNGK